MQVRKRRLGFRFLVQALALHGSPLHAPQTPHSDSVYWRGAQVELLAYLSSAVQKPVCQ